MSVKLGSAIVVATVFLLVLGHRLLDESDRIQSPESEPGRSKYSPGSLSNTGTDANKLTVGSEGESETELVHGIAVKKDRNCSVRAHYVETSPGITAKAYSCEPDPKPAHPYESYSNQALAVLAYSDAQAARILGLRSVANHEEALQWFARAAALLDGDPEPLLFYSNLYAGSSAVNGEAVAKTHRDRLALAIAARRLDEDSGDVDFWMWQVQSHFTSPAAIIDDAEAEADRIISHIRDIQITVIGRSSTPE